MDSAVNARARDQLSFGSANASARRQIASDSSNRWRVQGTQPANRRLLTIAHGSPSRSAAASDLSCSCSALSTSAS